MELLRLTHGPVAIIATTVPLLYAENGGGEPLAEALGVLPPPAWPPQHNDQTTREWLRRSLEKHPEEPGYAGWYIIGADELVGTAGFKGRPNPKGEVEIGYSVVPQRQRRGFASGAVELLVRYAFGDPRVTSVRAETLPDGIASQAVLRRCGFVPDGTRVDPDDGEVACFRRKR